MRWILVYWVYSTCTGNALSCDPTAYQYKVLDKEADCVWAMETFQKAGKNNRAVCISSESEWAKSIIDAQT